jgi:hypothetical protein
MAKKIKKGTLLCNNRGNWRLQPQIPKDQSLLYPSTQKFGNPLSIDGGDSKLNPYEISMTQFTRSLGLKISKTISPSRWKNKLMGRQRPSSPLAAR